ncbi:Uncharacterised protein [Klebsiella pneumoniae]|nr:Uncharacterised protein [Klebsiella pneumoniae]
MFRFLNLGVVTSVHICAIIATVLAVIVLHNMVSTFTVRDTNVSGAVYPIPRQIFLSPFSRECRRGT